MKKREQLDQNACLFIAQSGIDGHGLFVTESVSGGDVITELYGEIASTPNHRSIQIGRDRHVHNKYVDYINHACAPNAYICVRGNAVTLIALRPIVANSDEITLNYNYSEYSLAHSFKCRCCPEHNAIMGYRYIAKDADRGKARFSDKYVLPYLRDLATEEFGAPARSRRPGEDMSAKNTVSASS